MSNDLGIVRIASYVPKRLLDNRLLAQQFGKDADFVIDRVGAHSLPVIGEEEETSDIAVEALNRLLRRAGVKQDDVDCLVLCTQNPDGYGLPHTSAIVQDKAGLPTSIAAFDVSLGCSGYIYGLKILKGFMEESGAENGILVTADPYSRIIDPEDGDTRMLFGDAATATLLSRDGAVLRLGKSLFSTDGSGARYLQNVGGRLKMNGRQVFNFAATKVPAQVSRLLELEQVTMAEIDKVIFHQGSKYIVETLGRRLRVPDEKLVVDIKKTGNTVSSSIPLLLERYLDDESVHRFLVSGFGVGLSWASALLCRIKR